MPSIIHHARIIVCKVVWGQGSVPCDDGRGKGGAIVSIHWPSISDRYCPVHLQKESPVKRLTRQAFLVSTGTKYAVIDI